MAEFMVYSNSSMVFLEYKDQLCRVLRCSGLAVRLHNSFRLLSVTTVRSIPMRPRGSPLDILARISISLLQPLFSPVHRNTGWCSLHRTDPDDPSLFKSRASVFWPGPSNRFYRAPLLSFCIGGLDSAGGHTRHDVCSQRPDRRYTFNHAVSSCLENRPRDSSCYFSAFHFAVGCRGYN